MHYRAVFACLLPCCAFPALSPASSNLPSALLQHWPFKVILHSSISREVHLLLCEVTGEINTQDLPRSAKCLMLDLSEISCTDPSLSTEQLYVPTSVRPLHSLEPLLTFSDLHSLRLLFVLRCQIYLFFVYLQEQF